MQGHRDRVGGWVWVECSLEGISIENFMKKVEAVHCIACEMFIPMQNNAIQRHMKTFDHNRNRKMMLEQSKRTSLQVAKSILNNRNIVTMLEKYLKGENPFTEEDAKGNEDGIDDPLEDDAGENVKEKKDEIAEGEWAEIKREPGEEGDDGKIVNADQTIIDKSEQGADATHEEGKANLTGDQYSEEFLPTEESAEVAEDEDKILEAGDGENPDEGTESPSGGGDDTEDLEEVPLLHLIDLINLMVGPNTSSTNVLCLNKGDYDGMREELAK
eukprot:g45431.t1